MSKQHVRAATAGREKIEEGLEKTEEAERRVKAEERSQRRRSGDGGGLRAAAAVGARIFGRAIALIPY